MTISEHRLLHWHGLVVPVEFQRATSRTWQYGSAARAVRLICLHSAECSESSLAAENLQSWAAGSGAPSASWHFAVDNNSITQSVELCDIAWHAGPINGFSVGIEQAGKAAQTSEQWHDDFSSRVLDNTARLIALVAGLYDLPIEHCANPKAQDARGVCTHYDVTKAWGKQGGHWDPGPNYPLDEVLEMARAFQLEAVQ